MGTTGINFVQTSSWSKRPTLRVRYDGRPNIPGFMEQRGYRHVHFDGLNDFYLEKEFPAPEGLTLPPNVFDRFVPHQIADLRKRGRIAADELLDR